MARNLLIFTLFLLGAKQASASSCCGQSPASYQVLYQQQKYSLSPGVTYTQSLGRVYDNPDEFYVWNDDKRRSVQSLTLNGAAALSERQQLFVSTAYLSSSYAETSAVTNTRGTAESFADTLLGYSFEVLPEYTFSAWKPVIFLSAFVNVPTGRSIYDRNELSEGADVTGHNQWGAGVGITVRKVIFPYTLLVQAKALRLLEKEFEQISVSGFYDNSAAAFVTYATPFWEVSVTGGMTWNNLTSRRVSASGLRSGSSNVTTVIASLTKPINDDWSVALAVADQSLIGSPQNTLLNRSYTLNFNYNFF